MTKIKKRPFLKVYHLENLLHLGHTSDHLVILGLELASSSVLLAGGHAFLEDGGRVAGPTVGRRMMVARAAVGGRMMVARTTVGRLVMAAGGRRVLVPEGGVLAGGMAAA